MGAAVGLCGRQRRTPHEPLPAIEDGNAQWSYHVVAQRPSPAVATIEDLAQVRRALLPGMAGTGVMRQSKPAFPSAFEDRKKYHSVEATPGTTPLTHAAHLGDNETVKRLIASGQRIYVDRLSHDYEAFHRSQRLLRIILAFVLGNYLFICLGTILLEIFFPQGSVTGFLWASVALMAAIFVVLFVVFILPVLIPLYVFLAKIYAGSIIALRLYTWLLALVALLAGLVAVFVISVRTYALILSPSPDELARKGVSLCLLVAVSAAFAYLFHTMLAGHIIALKDKEKLAILVDPSFPSAIFRNLIPNIFRILGVPASNVLPSSRRRKAYALIVGLLGLACEGASFIWYVSLSGIIFAWVEHFQGPLTGDEPQFFATGIMFVVLIILPVSNLFSFLSRRLRAFSQRLLLQNADEIRKFDSRYPILLLRSFADDQVSLRTIYRSRHIKLLQLFDSGVHINTLDELLVQRYSYIGPVIAIGNPEDEIPPLGASRKYVKGTAWEQIVVSLMRQSAIVVIAVGDTESLLWEVHQLGLLDLHRKAIFVMPPDRTKDYCLMRKLMEAVGATAGPEPVLGKDTNGPMSKEYRPKSDEHILSMVYDDGKTWFTCIAQTKQVTEMQYEMALRLAIRHIVL